LKPNKKYTHTYAVYIAAVTIRASCPLK